MLGPFDVTADQIVRLTNGFTPAINQLLAAETAAAKFAQSSLVLTNAENVPDGGVDAAIRSAPTGGDWIPEGDSAWQFKRSGLSPGECAAEFKKATWAHEMMKTGASYVLAVGADLNDRLLATRKLKVFEKAVELGVLTKAEEGRIRVYGASALARWVSQYPALAVSRVMGGPGGAAVDFDYWSRSRVHQTQWTPDHLRQEFAATLIADLFSDAVIEIRVQGDPGVGKTRFVMEALRGTGLESLVAYVANASELTGELLGHLASDGRTSVLVVDDCPAEQHASLAARLPDDPKIRLVTIGHLGTAAARRPTLQVDPMDDDSIETLLARTFISLSDEARRFVVDHAAGNPRWANLMATRVVDAPIAQAADLILRNDLGNFVSTMLPEGRDLFIATALALFERVGWDRERSDERNLLADFLGVSQAEISATGAELDRLGIFSRHGRYRMVGPHPLAVYLASRGWEIHGHGITGELLGNLSDSMALALFRRVADLGRFAPAQAGLIELMGADGPFSSLEAIERSRSGRLLTQLAIVLPDEVTRRLSTFLDDATDDELRELTSIRRDLVWTLEKLSWHTETFAPAANCLLRLAQAENESYGNNATGTWRSLFGALIPATAASPEARIDYLQATARSPNPNIRRLAVAAATRATDTRRESTMVSGELQGGVLVEPRGRPGTWGEVWSYQAQAIDLLALLGNDPDLSVRTDAQTSLLKAINALVGVPQAWESLRQAIIDLPALHVGSRQEIRELSNLYDRRQDSDDSPEERQDRQRRLEQLIELESMLPPPSPEEELHLTLAQRRWSLDRDELSSDIEEAMRRFLAGHTAQELLGLLGSELHRSWEFGSALASLNMSPDETLRSLVLNRRQNPRALVGYIHRSIARGSVDAAEALIDSDLGIELTSTERLELALLSPDRARSQSIVEEILGQLPVSVATRYVPPGGTTDEVLELLRQWGARLETQQDYDALVEWLYYSAHRLDTLDEAVVEAGVDLLLRRRDFPSMGQADHPWGELGLRLLPNHEHAMAALVLDLVDEHDLMIIGAEPEALVLEAAIRSRTADVWQLVADRMETSWRIGHSIRGWLLSGIDTRVVADWVGKDIARGRVAAQVAPIGSDKPTPIVAHLLTTFEDDERITSSLYGSLVSGVWVGNESLRIEGHIELLRKWEADPQQSRGVHRWAARVLESLERSRQDAVQREAERDTWR